MVARRSVGAGNLATGMRIGLGIDISPTPLIMEQNFKGYARNIKSFKEPLERSIRQVMIPSFRKNFEVGGRPTWPPLAEYTKKVKGHSRPLIRTGNLMNAAQQLNIWKIEGPQGRAYVSHLPGRVWYGKIHQAGSVGARQWDRPDPVQLQGTPLGETPARPFLVVQPDDVQKIQKIFAEWAIERAQGITRTNRMMG